MNVKLKFTIKIRHTFLVKHMKSGAPFNRPNKLTEGPATKVNKQNLNFRLRIQENLSK